MLIPDLVRIGGIYTDDMVAQKMRSLIGDFVETYIYLERKTPKITRDKARFLNRVILFRSLNDACEINPDIYETWPNEELELAMAHGTPTTTDGRTRHKEAQRALRQFGFRLTHNDTVIRWAEIWYLVRVNPGNIPDTLELLATTLDRGSPWGSESR